MHGEPLVGIVRQIDTGEEIAAIQLRGSAQRLRVLPLGVELECKGIDRVVWKAEPDDLLIAFDGLRLIGVLAQRPADIRQGLAQAAARLRRCPIRPERAAELRIA